MYRVVLIDDEEIILRGLQGVVEWQKYGCEIVGTADDGVSGLALIQNIKPDIIFTDIRMPEKDGLEMLEALKSELKEMQVTIMTGFRDLEYAQQAIKLGITRYLLKPSQIEEIEEAILCMVENIEEKRGYLRQQTDNYLVNNVLDYIDRHYSDKVTLAEIAEQNYVSVWHLSKLINKYCNKNFRELLNEIRMEHAKHFLLEDNSKVYAVSERVGITDITYFSRVFKKYVGVTPNEYRNQRSEA
ncbi:MAG: response regulator [Cellulosilyticaceae bacterium]